MIGIVVVSHSRGLAEAALQLARQMVPGDRPPVRLAAGAGVDADGAPILGTDATLVAAAIGELQADGVDGVLVLMDLGSAVLSAELAVELAAATVPVRLAPAPFVEGLLAAVVSAAAGASLDAVAAEAAGALEAKTGQLGDADVAPAAPAPATTPTDAANVLRRRVVVRNPLGIHARPAALIAGVAGASEARLRLRRLPDGPEADAASLSRLLVLGARRGDELELTASGPDAADALDTLAALVDDGFGELDAAEPTPAEPSSAEPTPAESTRAEPTPAQPTPAEPAAAGVLRGRGVSAGRAAAPAAVLAAPIAEPSSEPAVADADREAEAGRIAPAAAAVAHRLAARAAAATGEAKDILEATALMAEDPDLVAGAADLVRTAGLPAARALWDTAGAHERLLASLGGRMAERVTDIRDVRDRIVAELLGIEVPGVPDRDDPFVLIARDLAPADTATLGGSACVALVTELGGPNSHTAIIARALGLPAVVSVHDATAIANGTPVLVDGEAGSVELDPPADVVAALGARAATAAFDGHGVLADGHAVPLLANVGTAADAVSGAAAGAEGVGLFRTEFCFLDRDTAPTIDEQVAAYRGVLAPFAGKKVVVRTLDAGSDKPLPFANADEEENPALGVRGLRIARRNPALLDDQLAALAIAAAAEQAKVEVMAPMVATIDEARDFADRCRAAGLQRVGVMIETPSAALLARELFEVVDFVSLGTNDLTQYTMAADRLLGELADLGDAWQPAVLRLIATVGEAGAAAGKPVGVCGEAGGDPALAPVLVGLGVTSLSMTPRALGTVAERLGCMRLEECRRAAAAAIASPTAAAARAAATAELARVTA